MGSELEGAARLGIGQIDPRLPISLDPRLSWKKQLTRDWGFVLLDDSILGYVGILHLLGPIPSAQLPLNR